MPGSSRSTCGSSVYGRASICSRDVLDVGCGTRNVCSSMPRDAVTVTLVSNAGTGMTNVVLASPWERSTSAVAASNNTELAVTVLRRRNELEWSARSKPDVMSCPYLVWMDITQSAGSTYAGRRGGYVRLYKR